MLSKWKNNLKRTLNVLAVDMNYLDVCDFEGENVGFEFSQTWGLDSVTSIPHDEGQVI